MVEHIFLKAIFETLNLVTYNYGTRLEINTQHSTGSWNSHICVCGIQ